jgi:hypothetical protein
MRIQNTLGVTSAHESYGFIQVEVSLIGLFKFWRFLWLQRHHGGAKCCFVRIQNVWEVAQCSFRILRELIF